MKCQANSSRADTALEQCRVLFERGDYGGDIVLVVVRVERDSEPVASTGPEDAARRELRD